MTGARARWLLVLALLAAATPAAARFGGAARMRPIRIELHGHLGAPDPNPRGETKIALSYGGKVHPFALTELRVIGAGPLPEDILRAVRPYGSTFVLQGSKATLEPLATSHEGDAVVVEGALTQGRNVLVSAVRAQPR